MHFCPLIASFANALLTHAIYSKEHFIYCLPIGVVYAAFNYTGTLYHGKPMYPFMNWEDVWTLLNSLVLIGISMLQYLGVASFINWTKKRSKVN